MKTEFAFLKLIFIAQILDAALARENKPLDLFNPLRSLELNTLEEEALKLERPLSIPASRVKGTKVVDLSDDPGADFDCQQDVMIFTEIVYDEEIRCNHVTYTNCYEAYKTVYKPQITEACRENFKMECNIEYEEVAKTEVLHVCSSKADRNCSAEGEEVCSTIYDTVCITKNRNYNIVNDVANCKLVVEEKCLNEPTEVQVCRNVTRKECDVQQNDVTKGFPETECQKLPREVCGPELCPIVEHEVCEDKEKTFVTSVPKEVCELKPMKVCTNETVTLPVLQLVNECVQVPKEVCSLEKVNPRQVAKPVTKKFCKLKGDSSAGTRTGDVQVEDGHGTQVAPQLRSEDDVEGLGEDSLKWAGQPIFYVNPHLLTGERGKSEQQQ